MIKVMTIPETTRGHLGRNRVSVGNMLAQETYTLPDGSQREGPTCMVSIEGEWVRGVGLGSVVSSDGFLWRVVEIEKIHGEPGLVTFRVLEGVEALDFHYQTPCPHCGQQSGWSGNLHGLGETRSLEMVCPGCREVFQYRDETIAEELAGGVMPAFVPGRDLPRSESG